MTVIGAGGKPRSCGPRLGVPSDQWPVPGDGRVVASLMGASLTASPPWSRSCLLLRQYPCRQHRHGPSGRALRLAFRQAHARDVEVGPVEFLREPRQKARRRNAAAGATADIGEIREVAVEPLLIIVPERQLPGTVIRIVASANQGTREGVAVA